MSAPSPTGPWAGRDRLSLICRWILRRASRLVSPLHRRDWLAEREGELWALRHRGRRAPSLIRFALDGLADALRERGGDAMGGLGGDLRHAIRGVRHSPGTALVTVLVLAVGIGANTAIFSVLHAALMQPVPFYEPQRLVAVDLTAREASSGEERPLPFSWPTYRFLEERTAAALHMAGFVSRDVTLLGAGDPARVTLELVTPSYFDVLGIGASAGRTLDPAEAPPAAAPVVVLSDGLWTSRFGRDPAVLGRSVRLDGATVTVIGVLPPGFHGLTGNADAWVSMALAPRIMDPRRLERRQAFWFYAVGRLSEGRRPEDAAAAVERAGHSLAEVIPDGGEAMGARIVPFLEARVNPGARLSVLVVGAAAALLLLIGCANVAGLQVARAAGRQGDLAVRVALGAGRLRLLRARLVESLLTAIAGGLMGVGAAYLGVRVLAEILPVAIGTEGSNLIQFLDPRTIDVHGPVLLFAVGVTLGTGLLSGALPALNAGRAAAAPGIHRARTRGGSGTDRNRARHALVASQLAVAMILLAGAGLMLSSLARLQGVRIGVDDRSIILGRYELPRGTAPEEAAAFHRALEDRLEALPGVRASSLAQCTPVSGRCDITLASAVDGAAAGEDEGRPATMVFVGDDYFRTVGIPLIAGRAFGPDDREGSPLVVVVSEGAARQLFPGREALDAHLTASIGPLAEAPGAQVVGVVGDVRYDHSLAGDIRPAVYVSYRQLPVEYMTILLGTDAPPATVVPALRGALGEVRPDVPLFGATTLADQIRSVSARTRVILALLVLFAGTAVLLSALGVFGLTSFMVARRTRELGVRMALGASGPRVLLRVLAETGVSASAGLLAGVAGALALTRLMVGLLFRVEPDDPAVLASVATLLLVVTLAAALMPAIRATHIDPAESLRAQ